MADKVNRTPPVTKLGGAEGAHPTSGNENPDAPKIICPSCGKPTDECCVGGGCEEDTPYSRYLEAEAVIDVRYCGG